MKHSIGLDVGGTKIKGVLIDETGKILKMHLKSTQAKKGKDKIIENILETIEKLKSQEVKGVGIGVSGFVDEIGKFIFSSNVPLLNVNLKTILEEKLEIPVYLENDANCFALAEFMYGAGKNSKNLVGIIIGTGIGAGLILEKQIYSGSIGGAGEIGHILIDPSSKFKCVCGKHGDFEALCSGPGIIRRYQALGGKLKNPNPAIIYNSKEKVAKKVIKDTYKYLGLGISSLVNTLNPDLIVLGGGVSNLPFYKEINREVKKNSIPILAKHVKVVKNKLGNSSGVLGAAALVFQD